MGASLLFNRHQDKDLFPWDWWSFGGMQQFESPQCISPWRHMPFFSQKFCVSIWIPSDSNKPITRKWVCAFRINIPTLILINSTLFFPSIIAVRWVRLSILFPIVLSGSRIKASSLVEHELYLFLKKRESSLYCFATWSSPRWLVMWKPLSPQIIKSHIFLLSLDSTPYPHQHPSSKLKIADRFCLISKKKKDHQCVFIHTSCSKC